MAATAKINDANNTTSATNGETGLDMTDAQIAAKKFDKSVMLQNLADEKTLPAPVEVEPGITKRIEYAYDRKNKSDQLKDTYVSYSYNLQQVTLDTLVDFVSRTYGVESPESYIIDWFGKSQVTKSRNAKALELRQSRDDRSPFRKLQKMASEAKPGSKKALFMQAELDRLMAEADAIEDEDDTEE